MTAENKTYFVILFALLISILMNIKVVNKYDKYEISTDDIENHAMIKGDIPSIWENG